MALLSVFTTIFQAENAVTISLCTMVFAIVFRYFRRNAPNLPPGPFQWPVVGSLPLVLKSRLFAKEHNHELMTRLARRYGKIFTLGLPGGKRIIVLNDFKTIKEAFRKPELSDRQPMPPEYIQLCGGQGVLQASGKIWKQQRRFSMTAFRGFGVGKTSFDEFVEIEGNQLSEAITELSDKPFNIRQLLMNATSNIICTIGFGKRFDYQDEEFRRLSFMLDERVKMGEEIRMYSQIPLFKWFRSNLINKFGSMTLGCINYFNEVVGEHKKRFAETDGQCNDLTDMYIKAMQESRQGEIVSGNNDADDKRVTLNEGDLANLVNNLFAAGTETSSNTLAWCLLHLIADPDLQQKIRDEIRAVCGQDQMSKYSDRSNMPLTEAVILEVQRLHTVAPLVLHCAGKETTLQGHIIPEGSLIMANLWAVHHDPDVWEEPDVFRPSRFLDQDGHITVKEEWTPFSIGRRVCLGEKLARMEIFIFLTHLLSRFSFKKPDHIPSVSFKAKLGATYGPQPFQICAEAITC